MDAHQEEAQAENEQHWTRTLQDFLKESRLATTQETRPKRGKKLNVAPGKAIKKKDLDPTLSSDDTEDENIDLESSSGAEKETDSNYEDLELDAVTETEKISDQENLETDFDIIQSGTFMLVRFSCPNNSFKYYVGCVSEVIDKQKKIYYVNFLRKQKSEKLGLYFIYPNIKDQSIVESTQIFKILKNVKRLRRERFQFFILEKYKNIRIE